MGDAIDVGDDAVWLGRMRDGLEGGHNEGKGPEKGGKGGKLCREGGGEDACKGKSRLARILETRSRWTRQQLKQ